MQQDLTAWDDEIAIYKEISALLSAPSPKAPLTWHDDQPAPSDVFQQARKMWLPDIACLSNYRLLRRLGIGAKSVVYRARRLDTHDMVAIKVVDTKHLSAREQRNVYNEVEILRILNREPVPDVVVKLLDVVDQPMHVCLVQPLAHADLYIELTRRGKFTEQDSKPVMRNLMSAVDFLHQRGVVHRDIKLENILVEYEYDYPDSITERKIRRVILADFGLAKQLGVGTTTTPCGTMEYAAPEVLQRQYSLTVDLWGLGVVLYTLLCGFPPFYHDDARELVRLISTATFSFPSPWWDDVSNDAKQAVSGLFRLEPHRWTIRELAQCAFLKTEDKWQVPTSLHTPTSEMSFRIRNATHTSSGSGELSAGAMMDRARDTTVSSTSLSDPAFSGKHEGRRTSVGWVMPMGVLQTPAEPSPHLRSPALARSPVGAVGAIGRHAKRPQSPLILIDAIRPANPSSPMAALPPLMTTTPGSSFASAMSFASHKSDDSKTSRASKESDYFEHGTLRQKRIEERAEWEKHKHRHHNRTGARQAPFEAPAKPPSPSPVSPAPGQLFVSPSDLSPLQDSVVAVVSGSRWREQEDEVSVTEYASAVSSMERVCGLGASIGPSSIGQRSGASSDLYDSALSRGLTVSTPVSLPSPLNKQALEASYWAARTLFDVDDTHDSAQLAHSIPSIQSIQRLASPTSPRVPSRLAKQAGEPSSAATGTRMQSQPFQLKMSESTLLTKRKQNHKLSVEQMDPPDGIL